MKLPSSDARNSAVPINSQIKENYTFIHKHSDFNSWLMSNEKIPNICKDQQTTI